MEDDALPNTDSVVTLSGATLTPSHPSRFRVGDQIRFRGGDELALVTAVGASTVTLERGYGGTSTAAATNGTVIDILGNAALEGGDADNARFTTRRRVVNYTQIFSSTVEVSGSELAVRQIAVRDELEYLRAQRLRELLRDLENSVINGAAAAVTPAGGAAARRTMRGVRSFITTNRFAPGEDGFPEATTLTEPQLNLALRSIWQSGAGNVDLVVVGGPEKRAINAFVASGRRFAAESERFKDYVGVYESDFGVCRVVMSRHVRPGEVLLLDSSRIDVLPLAGRSFQYVPLARTGDREAGQLVGEYTVEFRNEACHGLISGLTGA
jgi:hypothetical protein